jgi:4-hydroxy-L-threonine phosphate dehydrogenase PdxA
VNGLKESIMMLAGPKLRVALVTNHVALGDVSSSINSELLCNKIDALLSGLKNNFQFSMPRIAVTGLNPHCSDSGLFGDQEEKIILPAIKKSQEKWHSKAEISGPLPADTAFHRAYRGEFDAVLCQYHDQGLGPLKLVHFDEAINITMGLIMTRVSPDHGPAEGGFLNGTSSKKSFESCFEYLGI